MIPIKIEIYVAEMMVWAILQEQALVVVVNPKIPLKTLKINHPPTGYS